MSKKAKYGRKSTIGKKISKILIGIFTLAIIYSGYNIVKYLQDGRVNKKIEEQVSQYILIEDDEEYKIDFEKLKEKNEDIVGFLKVNGTKVEHLVVQAEDNSYYLTKNLEKQYNKAGWVFADYRNTFDGRDKNIIIYGHNMRDDSMFGTLTTILDDKWKDNKENMYVQFITPKEEAVYEVFSVYQIEAEDYYTTTTFSEDEYIEFLKVLKNRSKYDFGVDVNKEDKILTLSTCANNNNYRIVLHAKKLENSQT